MSHGFEPTIIGLTTVDGGMFDMTPSIWQHFGILSTTPSKSRKTFSRMHVPLPHGVSRSAAEKLLEWCSMYEAAISPAAHNNVGPSPAPSPLDLVRPLAAERLQATAKPPGDRRFWAKLTLPLTQELLTAARACRILRLVDEAEWYIRDTLNGPEVFIKKRSRCFNCAHKELVCRQPN